MVGATIIVSTFFLTGGCSKDSGDSESDLIGNWTRASDFDGDARSEAVTFVIDDKAYISTGATDRSRFRDLWEFSTTRGYWQQKADLPVSANARSSAAGFAIGSKGYLGTGYDGANYLNDFWEYDPASNQWTQKDNFPGSARRDASGFAIGNYGYITCGYSDGYLKDLWQFNPAATSGLQWQQKASLGGSSGGGIKRMAATVFVLTDRAYLVSGNNNGEILKDCWMYNPSTDEWTEKRKIYDYSSESYDDNYTSIPRQNGVAFVMNDKAYLTTGENSSVISTTWEYNPSSDLWTEKTGFEGTARTGAVAFAINNRGFVITGRNGSSIMDNAYEFHPTEEKVDGD